MQDLVNFLPVHTITSANLLVVYDQSATSWCAWIDLDTVVYVGMTRWKVPSTRVLAFACKVLIVISIIYIIYI